MRRLATLTSLFGLLLLTSGCMQLVASAANQIAVAAVDAKVSDVLEKDCNSYRFIRGGEYCADHNNVVDPGPPLYCFKTLGGIECHREADPYAVGKTGRTTVPQPLRTPSYEVAKQAADEELAQQEERQKLREKARENSRDIPKATPDTAPPTVPQWVSDGYKI